MNTPYRSILAGLLIAIAILAPSRGSFAVIIDKNGSTTASGSKPITPGATLDNFEYAAPLNLWSAPTGTFSSSAAVPPPADAICTASYTNDPGIAYGGSGYSLKLNYNVTSSNSYAGYFSQLGSQSLSSPIAYTSVSFWIKGAAGGEFFKVQMKNATQSAAVYITDYLDGGVTQSWKKVTIPFHNLVNLSNFNSMSEFVIVFENVQCAINGSPTQGTVYIDNIKFETGTAPTVRIDHFGDKLGTSALGGNTGTMSGSGGVISYDFSNAANEYFNYANGLRLLNYNVTASGAWAGVFSLFGGGVDGWSAVPHDFSVYNYLYIRVRGSATGNPKEIRIELVDNGGSKAVRISTITTAWQYWVIALVGTDANPGFVGLDRSSIKQLNIIVEGNQIGYAGGSKTGTVYIDDIQFGFSDVP